MADIIEGFVSLVRPDQAIQSICKFAKKGQIKDAKKAMEKLGITADAKDETGMPPLHVAVQNNQMAFVEWLLDEMRVDILSTENSSLYTALHIAVKTENMDMAVALLRRGADPLRQSRRDGENPLELAESSGNNRFLLRFKEEMEKYKDRRKGTVMPSSSPPPPSSSSSSSSMNNSASRTTKSPPPEIQGSSGVDEFTNETSNFLRDAKKVRKAAEEGSTNAIENHIQTLQAAQGTYLDAIKRWSNGLPTGAREKLVGSVEVIKKGVVAIITVGRTLAANPGDAGQTQKIGQVYAMLDKHGRRMIEIIVHKNFNVE